MNLDRVRRVHEATEESWEATAAQWVIVFDAVTKTPEADLAPIEQAVWNTYTRARELRKMVSAAWLKAQADSRQANRLESLAEMTGSGEADGWIVE